MQKLRLKAFFGQEPPRAIAALLTDFADGMHDYFNVFMGFNHPHISRLRTFIDQQVDALGQGLMAAVSAKTAFQGFQAAARAQWFCRKLEEYRQLLLQSRSQAVASAAEMRRAVLAKALAEERTDGVVSTAGRVLSSETRACTQRLKLLSPIVASWRSLCRATAAKSALLAKLLHLPAATDASSSGLCFLLWAVTVARRKRRQCTEAAAAAAVQGTEERAARTSAENRAGRLWRALEQQGQKEEKERRLQLFHCWLKETSRSARRRERREAKRHCGHFAAELLLRSQKRSLLTKGLHSWLLHGRLRRQEATLSSARLATRSAPEVPLATPPVPPAPVLHRAGSWRSCGRTASEERRSAQLSLQQQLQEQQRQCQSLQEQLRALQELQLQQQLTQLTQQELNQQKLQLEADRSRLSQLSDPEHKKLQPRLDDPDGKTKQWSLATEAFTSEEGYKQLVEYHRQKAREERLNGTPSKT